MTTYYVSSININISTLYKGTSLNKAKKICDACPDSCYVARFAGYNIPLPVEYWNGAFERYVLGRGKKPRVGMTHW